MTLLKPSDISETAGQIYVEGSWLRRQIQILRPFICPFHILIQHIPAKANIMDIGCGNGLFLNLLAKYSRIQSGLGIDADLGAVSLAKSVSDKLTYVRNLNFLCLSTQTDWPDESFDVVSMVDVLHHIKPKEQKLFIRAAVSHVKDGGLFVYKDIACRPHWRALANRLHDLVMAREWINYAPLNDVTSWVQNKGFTVKHKEVVDMLWYRHELIVFAKTN